MTHARNTLDHGYDPLLAIREMARVTKPGGVVLLQHYPNEAARECYHGLHRWNLSVRDGRLLVSRPAGLRTEVHDVETECTGLVHLLSTNEDHDEAGVMDLVVLRRLPG